MKESVMKKISSAYEFVKIIISKSLTVALIVLVASGWIGIFQFSYREFQAYLRDMRTHEIVEKEREIFNECIKRQAESNKGIVHLERCM